MEEINAIGTNKNGVPRYRKYDKPIIIADKGIK